MLLAAKTVNKFFMAKNATPTTKTAPQTVKAYARQLHISPRKMRLVTNMVRGMYASDAVAQLQHANKKAAPMVVKLLKSAIANAEHNFSLNPEWLYIKSITTDMGTVMKRYFPRARGSAFVIRRKMAHVSVVLEERKRGKVAAGKMSLIKRIAKSAPKSEAGVDAKDAAGKPAVSEEKKKAPVPKTGEQVKENRVQQKRRLFNRKSGE